VAVVFVMVVEEEACSLRWARPTQSLLQAPARPPALQGLGLLAR